ncbi:MAG: hypothetical protein EA353_11055 [Puniceicoccaceae bacterium]|nr:MAG: hypothetical protein EA353_11055 [Puniceicoccaceae bacterium]
MLTGHKPMRFRREGRHLELELSRGVDIRHLSELDEVLWVALSSPAAGLEFDRRTLELLDADRDGRIRTREVRDAAKWLDSVLLDLSILEQGRAIVPLSQLRADTDSGRAVGLAARRILANLGKPEADQIALLDLGDRSRIESAVSANGDGVIDAGATEDPALILAIDAILRITGGERDLSGTQGIGQASVAQFFAEYARFRNWLEAERTLTESQRAVLLPFGDVTAAAFRSFEAVEAALDQFFGLCQLVAYDRAVEQAAILCPGLPHIL